MAILFDLTDETLHRVLEFVTNDRESLENASVVNTTGASTKSSFLSSCANGTIAKNVLNHPSRDLLFIFSETLIFDGALKGWTLDTAEKDLQFPLGHIRHVTSQPWNSEELFDMAYARSFLHLPRIQTICAYGMLDYLDNELDSEDDELLLTHLDDYLLPFPVSTSPITELTIVGCLRFGAPDSTTACRALTKVRVRVDDELYSYGWPDRKELAEAVMKYKGSLEDLDIDINVSRLPNPDPVLEETYSHMSRIQTVAVPITDFFKGFWSNGVENCIKVVLDRIPQGIQVLKPRSQRFIESWLSSSNDVFLEPYLEGIIELLDEAGLQGRFSKFRVLDLSEAFVDDPIMFATMSIKELARPRGVKCLLYN
ncbi:hypothetical protein FAGAP_2670 [Fusarium agapanthi]|uniref:F-box domain-containing protein n=1 Tax=Fusarium agapanthi TaxID=1803897 RepID=A0A9P5BFJ9_9HYPO|nr:hypothetical protein FAGAP_2670 [Fusarium agapanthi]